MIDFILQKQCEARLNEEKRRMLNAAIAIDFYNGQQKCHMKQVLAQLYPNTWEDVVKYIATCDLTKSIIDQKSILFQAPPEIEIVTENEKLQLQMQDMIEKAEMHKKLIVADRMTELTGKIGITQHWHEADQRVVVDILTPDKTFVVYDPEDPTKAQIVYYLIGKDTDARLATPVNIYGKWTRESYSEVALNTDFQEIRTVTEPIPNRYGYLPVVWLSSVIEIDEFWQDHGYPIVEANINVNIRESNLDIALDFQSFSTLVTTNSDSKSDHIQAMTRRLDLQDGFGDNKSSAYYITPDAKLSEVAQIIHSKKVAAAQSSGLSADAFNQNSSNITSGYQLRLTQKQLEEQTALKKSLFREPLKQLIKNMMVCYSIGSTANVFPSDAEVYFQYVDRPTINNPIETTQLQIMKMQAGLMSLADAIRENNPALTQEEAIEEAKRIKAETQQLNGVRQITEADLVGI